ncbi:hypothetical protein DSL72_005120 [Monilinia vaccinii-corymbosi]|uniref:J domain-containing protein n=1 Tax=Monilinia vaccinii-corymbosi TaxID=61207 RepID=A0A8A3PEB4_9HELO|nr:hypothetical protein DSL72_005120 [Monilinia vaccinii-corymbosi]
MVKADFDRDYYADLDIDQGASISEIKKQFRKLALVYHPDRNLGNESDMNAKFQAIQSAHEVLTDPLERQRYDDMRSRVRYTTASAFRSTKGNPYSNYGSEFPRPPKPPPYRPNRNPPPQSAGAARYSTFQTPRQSASAAAQEGPEARKSTFNAWESMKGHQKTSSTTYRTGSGSTWNTPKAVPKEYVPQSGREESNSFKHTAPPRPKPGYEEFRSGSYHTRNQSTPPPVPKRNGFMPSNPGADEPPAGKGNYSTSRVNRSVPPPPPPRETPSFEQEDEEKHIPAPAPPVNHTTRPSTKTNDPLRQFRTAEEPSYEPRLSTPYASSGGEKFDPFDAANLGRSKSTREDFAEPKAKTPVPRAGSDPSLASPHPNGTPKNDVPMNDTPMNDTPKNDTPKNDTPKNDTSKNDSPKPTPAFAASPDTPDSGNDPEFNPQKPRVFAKPRKPTPAQEQRQAGAAAPGGQNQSKRYLLRDFRQWMKDNPNPDYPQIVNPFADGPPAQEEPSHQPSMYETSSKYTASNPKERPRYVKHASFSGNPLRQTFPYSKSMHDAHKAKYPESFTTPRENPTAFPPSGGSSDPLDDFQLGQKDKLHHTADASTHSLNSFAALQHNLVNHLLVNKKRAEDSHQSSHVRPVKSVNHQVHNDKAIYSFKSTSDEEADLTKEPSYVPTSQFAFSAGDSRLNSLLLDKLNAHANINSQNSFSMKLDDETFSPTRPNAFPRASADNINTKFSSEEWHGKFQAGGDYFVPEQKTTQLPLRSRVRTQSTSSRSRGRSPVKSRSADSKPFPPRPDSDTPIESPGGTKFSAQDWAETFKPQTFAPPLVPSPTKTAIPLRLGSRKPRIPIAKSTACSAAVVIEDDSDDSDEKPLFKGRAPKTPKASASPDAMDVDSPPPATPALAPQAPPPQAPPSQAPSQQAPEPKANGGLKINTEPLKRAAAPSQSPIDTDSLKVEFDDLNIKELLSSLDLPPPPTAPRYSHESNIELSQGIYLSSFTAYMGDWDLFAKRMMLHLIARKNQNDGLGSNRWENSQGLDIYRLGLKEDAAVMGHWVAAMANHDQAMKEYAIHKERFNIAEDRDRERPRKKTH